MLPDVAGNASCGITIWSHKIHFEPVLDALSFCPSPSAHRMYNSNMKPFTRKTISRLTAFVSMFLALLLCACDLQPVQPPASPVIPTGTPGTASTSSVTPAQTTVNSGEEGLLVLQPVEVEVPEASRTGNFTQTRTINLPAGFGMKVFATGLQHVRMLALSPSGELYATVRAEGRIVSLPDSDNDGVADSVRTFADGLEGVHGIAFRGDQVYAATETSILRFQDTDKDGTADSREVLVNDMPTGGTGRAGANHSTRTIHFGPDGKLYVAMGSSCNACVEEDPRRAAISLYSADGKLEKVYARGIRNAVGFAFHPITGELWAANNGRDGLGPDLPPEAIYKIREDANYGWPYCYGERVPDSTMDVPAGYCDKTDVPTFTIAPHSAPLGLAFYTGDQFPQEYKGDMFLTSHGSWDREVRIGYKLMRVRFKDNQPDTAAGNLMIEDFATGWLTDPISGAHWGRPVLPLVAPDGSLFLTDDASMSIYKIYYKGTSGR